MHFNGGSVSVILLSPLFINLNYPLPFGVIVSFLFIVLKFYFKTKTCLGKFVVSFDIYQILKLFLYHKPQTIKIPYVCSLFSFLQSLPVGFCSGYVPPEYVRKGIYSTKYDVYSFGVLLLQIISGKRTSCYYGTHENMTLLEYLSYLITYFLYDYSIHCMIYWC